MGGRLLDFLGQGLAAARPAAAGVPALIPTGSAAVYYAYDTGIFSFFDEDAVDWVELDLGALSAIGFQNLADVDWTTPPTDGQFFVWDNTAGKFVPADAPAEYTDTDADARVAAGIATHEGEADPHPGYLTPTEGDAAYAPIAHVGSGGAEHDDAVSGGASGFMTGADKAKLDGVAAGATDYDDADADARIAAASIGDLNDVNLSTPPTDGQILVWDDGAGEFVPDDPGGVGSLVIDDLGDVDTTTVPPVAGDLLRFDGTDWVPAKGGWDFNPPLAASFSLASSDATNLILTDDADVGLLVDAGTPVNSAARWAYRTLTTKTAAWSMIAKLPFWYPDQNFSGIGLQLQDSIGGRHLRIAMQNNELLAIHRYSALNTYSSTDINAGVPDSTFLHWLRVDSDGVDYTFLVSSNGKQWILLGTIGLTAYLAAAADRVGFFCSYARTTGAKIALSCPYFSLTGPAV